MYYDLYEELLKSGKKVKMPQVVMINGEYLCVVNGMIRGRMGVQEVVNTLSLCMPDWVCWDINSLDIVFFDDKENVIRLTGEYNDWEVNLWTDGENHTIRFLSGRKVRKFKYRNKSDIDKVRILVDYKPFK